MIIQELKKIIALFLLEANDIPRKLRIDVQRFLTSGRMCANNRVDLDTDQSIEGKVNRRVPTDDTGARLTKVPLASAA